MNSLRTIVVWVCAVSLCALPFIVAADFGGILRWTHLLIGLAVFVVTVASLAAFWDQENRGQLRQHVLLLPLGLWLCFSFFQTIALQPGIVKLLSPASHEAYTQWLQPIMPAEQLPAKFSISVSPHDSAHATRMLSLVFSVVFASAMVFCTRKRITMLLSVCSIGTALHVGFALMRKVFPGVDFYDGAQDLAPASFGAFINPNNAALFLNLGLGCSLGLMSWRLSALTGQELDDKQFEFNDLVALIGDRDSMIGVVCAVFCIGGLLICGSRGGIVAVLVGALLAFGWVRQKRGFATLPVMAVAVGFSAAILLVPLQLSMKSITRFEFFSADASTLASDGRLLIWPDGFRAGLSHLPAGSGLSTYAFSHLPYQSGVLKVWAQHADNLWLELFVEQGLFGVAFVLSILYLTIRSLNLLHDSPDPIDQGLRTAGWYTIGAVACSQFFDFGLILPANFLLLAIVFSAIIARRVSVAAGTPLSESVQHGSSGGVQKPGPQKPALPTKQNYLFASRRRLPVFVAISVGAIALPVLAIPDLKRSAEVESLVRTSQFQLEGLRTNSQGLSDWTNKLATQLRSYPEPQLTNALGDFQLAQARLTEVLEQRPKTPEEVEALFDRIKPAERKLEDLKISPAVMKGYNEAAASFNKSLVVGPLGVDARSGKLYLDFLQGDPTQTRTAIDQLFTLHRNSPTVLVLLGEYAANRRQYDQATKLWETAAMEQSNRTIQVVGLSQQYDQVQLADVIPDQPQAVRVAAKHLLKSEDEESIEYLKYSYDAVACGQCDSFEAESACFSLRGDIAYKLQRYDEAFKQYAVAIEREPTSVSIRLKLVQRLREQGRYADARIEARKGRDVIPSEKRFTSLIKAISGDELRQSNQP